MMGLLFTRKCLLLDNLDKNVTASLHVLQIHGVKTTGATNGVFTHHILLKTRGPSSLGVTAQWWWGATQECNLATEGC